MTGQTLVKTNSGMLDRASGGFEASAVVRPRATSNAMYVVTPKNAAEKKYNGCDEQPLLSGIGGQARR
jgi:hypothetical protein